MAALKDLSVRGLPFKIPRKQNIGKMWGKKAITFNFQIFLRDVKHIKLGKETAWP